MTARATIIVVTHNSARWLPRVMAALEAQTEQRFDLVVIDNASRVEERPDALPARARLIQSETNLGFAEANNRAAAGVQTPYLVFLNPDAFPKPDWGARLLALADADPTASAIGSTQLRADDEGTFDGTGDVMHASGIAYRSNYGRPATAAPPLGETFAACAAAMLVRRTAFEDVGGFDARYFCFFEDVDLSFRLRLRGGRVLQAPDAVVAHVGGGATSSAAFADFHGARNRTWTFIKCMPGPAFWFLLPLHLALSALATTSLVLRGRGFAGWRGLLAALARAAPFWKERTRIQRSRVATWREIERMLAWSPHVFFGRQPVIRPLRPD